MSATTCIVFHDALISYLTVFPVSGNELALRETIMDPYQHTFHIYNKVAQLYQDKFMDLDLYDDTYNRFCDYLKKPDASVFEIGCGPGNITRYLLKRCPALQIDAIDMAPNMLSLARENNPTARFWQMDARNIAQVKERYDGLVCGFCMPYLSREDCVRLIADSAQLLNEGGIFYFSLIEGDYARSGYETGSSGDSIYVYYHEAPYLLQALAANGFRLLEEHRKHYDGSKAEATTHLVLIAEKAGPL